MSEKSITFALESKTSKEYDSRYIEHTKHYHSNSTTASRRK